MKAVILAGGRGTRLAPVTHGKVPKPMAELLGRPVMEHIVRHLAECGFTELCCALGHMPDAIRRHFGDGSRYGVHMEYRTESHPLGTAGAVKNCAPFWQGEPFLVISADAACDFDLRRLWRIHRESRAAATMALYPHEAPLPYGLAVTDSRGFVRSIIEKPSWERVVTDLVNTGIYILRPEVMDFVPEDVPFDFALDLFPRLLEAGRRIRGAILEGYWRDIGDPGSYYRANLDAWEGQLRLPAADAPPPEETPAPPPVRYACRIYCPSPRRARLMRELTAGLMEAGADLRDGISLSRVPGGIHIAPCPDREAVCIESDSPDTARRFEALARRLEARMGQ
ncbi:MAG: nucleotidyltransferase family protein [Oscillospiraceae bacterium]|nr:nucleotidyltransferase family protein [Oscillospiraceae bacterium]